MEALAKRMEKHIEMAKYGSTFCAWVLHGALYAFEKFRWAIVASFGGQLWRFEYERETWGDVNGYIATLVLPGLFVRRIRGMWRQTKFDAETSACHYFKSDGLVQQVRPHLPPLMKKIRDFVSLDRTQKDGLMEKGVHPAIVQKDMLQQVYNGLRQVGCITSMWDRGHVCADF